MSDNENAVTNGAPPQPARKVFFVARIRAALRRQDWTAVGIELAVVVFGLFLGLQLNAWKEASDARVREHAALERLAAEAEADVSYINEMLTIFEKLVQEQGEAITALAAGDKTRFGATELAKRLDTVTIFPGIAPPRTVYDDLSNSGQINLITSEKVRSAVAKYYGGLAFMQSQLEYFRLIASLGFSQPGPGWGLQYNPKGERYFDRFVATADFDVIAKDRVQMLKLVAQLGGQLKFQIYRRELAESAIDMCKALSKELNKTCAAASKNATAR